MDVIVSGIEFDSTSIGVIVSGIEFDAGYVAANIEPTLPDPIGGGRAKRTTFAATRNVKSSPSETPSHYHSRAYEQEEVRLAALLDDEEIVLAFLMEIALHV